MMLIPDHFNKGFSRVQRIIGTIINHHVLANLLVVIIFLSGAIAALSMVRESFPEIKPTSISVTVIYPGADVEEVENGIAQKLEEAIDGLEGVKRYTTISMENQAVANIEIRDGFDMSKAKDLVENAVDSISTFPALAERPIVSEALFQRRTLLITLWGDLDERSRKEMAETIKDELQATSAVSQVSIQGVREYEIAIEIDEDTLQKYGITFEQVTQAINKGSVNLAGGTLRTSSEQINIRVSGRKYTGAELGRIVIVTKPDGTLITLNQIASIRDSFTEDHVIARFNGKPAVLITLSKLPGEDAIAIAKTGHEYVSTKSQMLPEGVHLTSWADGSLVIDDRLRITAQNGMIGLMLVVLTLWFFLNSRLSFWVAMGIPIATCGSLTFLWLLGATLNSVTLFGLIMVLGIVVDDAIVIAEAIYLRRKGGDGPLMAAVNGLTEVGLPVIAGVTTTIIAFLPLAFVSGVMGQFMGTMAIAVIGALVTSLLEALFILPAHLANLPSPKDRLKSRNPLLRGGAKVRARIEAVLDFALHSLYTPFVRLLIRERYISLCVAMVIVVITVAIIFGGYVRFTPFPDWDDNLVVASVEFPKGTSTEVTEQAILATEAGLYAYVESLSEEIGGPIIEQVFSVVGQGTTRGAGTHTGTIWVQLQHSNNRPIHSQEILAGWEKHVGSINGALSQTFNSEDSGPGGAAIELWIQGTETEVLRNVSKAIRERLNSYTGVYQVQDSFRPGKREIEIELKPSGRTLGLTLDDLARQVYAGFYGFEADRVQRGRDDIRIKVRYSDDERSSLSDLEAVRIRTPQGYEVPLFSVADAHYGAGPAVIERADGRRRITVTAQVDDTLANGPVILGELQAGLFRELKRDNPGVSISLEGGSQDSQESIGSLVKLFPIAMVAIFVIIAAIFRSYMQPVLVMITVPFGLIGAILGHVILDWQVVMFSIFGMMALTGVVVNDAIVMIEAINRSLSKGVAVLEAIAMGGIRRFRAILVTSISTIGALVPMIIETDLSAQPLNPMALSLACGVGFATILTLCFIPVTFAILSDFRLLAHFLRHGEWVSRESLEPASHRNRDIFEGYKI